MTKKLDICLSINLLNLFDIKDTIVVVIDVLRATTAICEAFKNGVDKIIPEPDIFKAKEYKDQGYIVAAERNGAVLDFADFGNSPQNFTRERVSGKTVVYSTVNGVPAILKAKDANQIIIASFLNVTAVIDRINESDNDVLLLCAGWKGDFNLEDTLLAGAIAENLRNTFDINHSSDSFILATELWKEHESNLENYAQNFAQVNRLRRLNINDDLRDYFTLNTTKVVPIFKDGILQGLNS